MSGSMQTRYAGQYDTACVGLQRGNMPTADELIEECRLVGAIFYEDGPDDECFVVDFDRGVGPELYTERALRGSLP